MNVRELVYRSLLSIEQDGKYANLELSATVGQQNLTGRDRSFYTALLYGVTEKKITLDYWIEAFTQKRIGRLDRSAAILLRMGIYQIVFMDGIPDRAAVSQTVELGRRYAARAVGFLNGVLRNVCRQKENLPYPDPAADDLAYLSVVHSVPRSVCEIWRRDYPDRLQGILESLSSPPPLVLRVNTKKCDPESLIASYPDLNLQRCAYSPFGLICRDPLPLSDFPPIADGRCFVQGEASQIAGLVLDPKPGEFIIDVCAAPGGKSFTAALLTDDRASILAMDVHGSKLSLIRDTAERLGLHGIRTVEHDSTAILESFEAKADRVICDVPCSGLGVLGKKSDLRNNFEKGLDKLPQIQYNILVSSSSYLKPGGMLVYSTCTLNQSENESVVRRFLDENPGWACVPFEVGGIVCENGMLTLFPDLHHTDGFFISKIQKIGS